MTSQTKSLQLIDRRTIAQPDRRYWGTRATMGSELKYMYSIGLLDMSDLTAIEVPGADPANDYQGRGEPWFTFPTPPSQYEITEPASTVIIPTQDGGKYVESQGSLFKDIRIAGTVGLRPSPASNELFSGLAAVTGVSLTVPSILTNDERGLRPSEITGLDDITFLRNIFRGYWDLKKRNEFAHRVVMVWMYAKESEWYIVEPTSFTTTRDSSNPLSWNYNIQLRTLYRFDATIAFERDPVNFLQAAANVWNTVNNTIRDLARSINQIVSAVHFIVNFPINIATDFLNSVSALTSALVGFKSLGSLGGNFERLGMRTIVSQCESILGFANQIEYGRATGAGKAVFGGPALDPTDDAASTIHKNEFISAVKSIQRAVKQVHAVDAFFETPKQVQVTDYGDKYKKDGNTQFSVGSPLDPNNMVIPGSATEVEVSGDIRSMAKQYMGDDSYWKLLVILNDLIYPYIASVSSPGILSPGDKILIPKRPEDEDIKETGQETLTDESQQALSPTVRKYGRDLVLTDGSFGTDYADIRINQKGDLDVIEGIPNVSQAMMIKFSTEQGELPTHPTFGAKYPIGTKLLLGRIQEFALNTRRTLLSDSRVDTVDRLRIFAEGDQLNIRAKVKLKQTDTKLPVEFSVRR